MRLFSSLLLMITAICSIPVGADQYVSYSTDGHLDVVLDILEALVRAVADILIGTCGRRNNGGDEQQQGRKYAHGSMECFAGKSVSMVDSYSTRTPP